MGRWNPGTYLDSLEESLRVGDGHYGVAEVGVLGGVVVVQKQKCGGEEADNPKKRRNGAVIT